MCGVVGSVGGCKSFGWWGGGGVFNTQVAQASNTYKQRNRLKDTVPSSLYVFPCAQVSSMVGLKGN